eukprot:CCRYP_009432-RA/>CCRYP_009432-RA protein AED:0.21 eAED:0.21 QI:0/-1/0/1/-1/1/1/0/417
MTSPPNALLALADVASVYEECASYAASLASTSTSAAAPCVSSHLSRDATMSSVPARPASSRPAKKRPVPVELTHPDPDLPQAATDGSVNANAAPKNDCLSPSEPLPRKKAAAQTHSTAKSNKKPKVGKQNRRTSSFSSTPSFPAILMGILSTPQNSEFITFLKDNRRFVVLDNTKFESQVLPIHFGATPATSSYWNFTRMLDEWGFKSEKDDEFPCLDVYSHPKFRKGDWEECLKIQKPASFNPETMIDFKRTSPLLGPYGALVDNDIALPPLLLPCDQSNAHAIASRASLPQISQLEAPNASSIAFLNASLSKHMSATESSRILCNRLGLFQNSNALKAMMQAQQARSRVIAETVDTFQENGRPRTISPEFSQMARNAPSSHLDVLTERFIKQSRERMQSRQVLMSQFNGLGMPSI